MLWWMSVSMAVPPVAIGAQPELPAPPLMGRPLPDDTPEVVGGEQVSSGSWDDAVGIVFDDAYVGCTGTLVAPNVVITAGHCVEDGSVTQVVIGSTDWNTPEGEAIRVRNAWMHPTYEPGNIYAGRDIAVLKLARDSTYPPRMIGSGCVVDQAMKDGAEVTIVGFGRTNTDGSGGTTEKRAVDTAIVDADCSETVVNDIYTGCVQSISPGGEVGAGGRLDLDGDGRRDGPRDACFGDSGGPLYLHTDFGIFVVGVTSRSFLGVDSGYPCRDGGIWTRPDPVIPWIEEVTGVTLDRPTCNHPPEVDAPVHETFSGQTKRVKLEVIDFDSTDYTIEIIDSGELGTAEVRGEKRVFFKADPDLVGEGTLTIAVTDNGLPGDPRPATREVVIDVVVSEGCGCASAGSMGLGLSWMGLLALVVRRRRAT